MNGAGTGWRWSAAVTTVCAAMLCAGAAVADGDAAKEDAPREFRAPRVGSVVTVRLSSGQTCRGRLAGISAAGVILSSSEGRVTIRRGDMAPDSRTLFYADDFARVHARPDPARKPPADKPLAVPPDKSPTAAAVKPPPLPESKAPADAAGKPQLLQPEPVQDPVVPSLAVAAAAHRQTVEAVCEAAARAIRLNGWDDYLDAADERLLALTASPAEFQRKQQAIRLLDNEPACLVLAQATFIRLARARTLAKFCNGDGPRAFLTWLLTDRQRLDLYLGAIRPEDNVEQVLTIWERLWRGDPDGRDRYAGLALACALVYDARDRAYSDEDPSDQWYREFSEADASRKLRIDLAALAPSELVWVVDLRIPESEVLWAREHVKLSRGSWSKTYDMVPYLMSKAVAGEQTRGQQTLETILREGGICTDRAYFSAMTAKANGIPAMEIYGEGERGAHAWFGYKESDREWNMEAGRFTSDNFVAGTAKDPQTGRLLKEHELKLLTDSQRHTTGYDRAGRLLRLAMVFGANGDPDMEGVTLEMAVGESSRRLDAWTAYFAWLKGSGVPDDTWRAVLNKFRGAFKEYPDVLIMADDIEAARAAAAGVDPVKTLRELTRRTQHRAEDRTDLAVEQVLKLIDELENSNRTEDAAKAYENALRDMGDEPVAWRDLSRAYAGFAARHDLQDDALRDIRSVFGRNYPRPGRDYFAMTNYARMLGVLSQLHAAAGDHRRAERYTRDAEQISKEAADREHWSR